MIIKPLRELKNFPISGNKKAFDNITKAYKTPSPLLTTVTYGDIVPRFFFKVVVTSTNPCLLFVQRSDVREFPSEEEFNDQLIEIEGLDSDYFPANNMFYKIGNDPENKIPIRGGNNYYVDIFNREWVRISNEGTKIEEGTCTLRDIRALENENPPSTGLPRGEEPGEEVGGGGEGVIPRDTGGVIPGGVESGGGNNPNPPGDSEGRDNNGEPEPRIGNRFGV
jgi:hypothetical protein